jgi:rhamnulokinase
MPASLHLAIDLGAESGRVALGRLEGGRLEVEILHRFKNTPVLLGTHLHWDLPGLWRQILEGLKKAPPGVASLGVDGWGVDFALLGPDGGLVGLPHHYRDARHVAAYEQVLGRIPREEIFERTGIQFMPINTLYQLAALREGNPRLLEAAERLVMLPDLFHYWLCGKIAVEWTNASTTQLADPRTRTWSQELLERLGLPEGLFSPPVPPGTVLGPLRAEVTREAGQRPTVVAPCTHDTASAVAAIPAEGEGWAYISSGTWSLVGVELPEPVLSPQALAMNLTNEGGLDGSTRLLKNVMGLWLLQECRHAWGERPDYAELTAMAEGAEPFRSLVNPDDPRFLLTNEVAGPMPQRIQAYCRESGQPVPAGEAEIARTIYDSLALQYRRVVEGLERVTGRSITRLHVVGGGSQNRLLCQLTADVSGREVIAGPVEATTLGNLLVTARAVGALEGELRGVVRRSFPTETYLPRDVPAGSEAYDRLQALP